MTAPLYHLRIEASSRTTEELEEKGAALRTYGSDGAQTHCGVVQVLVLANGKVLAVSSLPQLRAGFDIDPTDPEPPKGVER